MTNNTHFTSSLPAINELIVGSRDSNDDYFDNTFDAIEDHVIAKKANISHNDNEADKAGDETSSLTAANLSRNNSIHEGIYNLKVNTSPPTNAGAFKYLNKNADSMDSLFKDYDTPPTKNSTSIFNFNHIPESRMSIPTPTNSKRNLRTPKNMRINIPTSTNSSTPTSNILSSSTPTSTRMNSTTPTNTNSFSLYKGKHYGSSDSLCFDADTPNSEYSNKNEYMFRELSPLALESSYLDSKSDSDMNKNNNIGVRQGIPILSME